MKFPSRRVILVLKECATSKECPLRSIWFSGKALDMGKDERRFMRVTSYDYMLEAPLSYHISKKLLQNRGVLERKSCSLCTLENR